MSVHIKLIFVVDYFCYILKTIRICNKNNNVFYLCIGTALGRLSIGTAKMNNWDVSGTGTSHSIGTFLPTKSNCFTRLKINTVEYYFLLHGDLFSDYGIIIVFFTATQIITGLIRI